MELDDKIYSQIELLSAEGNSKLDDTDYEGALESFQKAYDLLPEPKNKWSAYGWLLASIGDVYFLKSDYQKALNYFSEVYKLEEMLDNAFILLRIGQCFYNLSDSKNAKEYLLRAYIIEGEHIFKEDLKYYKWLKTQVNL